MKKFAIPLLFFAILAAAIFLPARNVAQAAFGISPPFLNADHLVPGANYVQTVYLVQDQPDQDLAIKATFSVPDKIVPWISIDKGLSFIIPKGTRQFPIQITINVPSGEGLGKYTGNISLVSQPTQSGQVTIALGANVAINLTIGNDIYENFSVPLIKFQDIEEGWNPKVYVEFDNHGNVSEAFDGATFELFDQYDAIRLAYIQKNDGFQDTKAFSTNEYTVEFPTDFHLGIGQYWGTVVFYQNGKVVASQKTIFHVLKAGSILGPWGSALYSLENSRWLMYVAIIVLIIIIAAIILYKRRRSK